MAESQDASTSGDSIRRRFLEFYASRGHRVLPSSSLVPDDPTVLLTIAGMLQFKPIFLGQVPICAFQLFSKSLLKISYLDRSTGLFIILNSIYFLMLIEMNHA